MPNKSQALTKAQQEVVDRLRAGWTIDAQMPDYMTVWITPTGRRTPAACPHPTLVALEKKGVVTWSAGRWILVDRPTSNAEDSSHAD
jgi:hypothetical protein